MNLLDLFFYTLAIGIGGGMWVLFGWMEVID